jgi:hypothetical protein
MEQSRVLLYSKMPDKKKLTIEKRQPKKQNSIFNSVLGWPDDNEYSGCYSAGKPA